MEGRWEGNRDLRFSASKLRGGGIQEGEREGRRDGIK